MRIGSGVLRRSNRTTGLLLLLALLLPAPVLPASAVAPRVQPALLAQAAAHPDGNVGVIVQASGPAAPLEALVARLGGRLTRDLHIINGFSATIPARAVATLAAADGVRWVSYDAPVRQADDSNTFTTWASSTGGGASAAITGNFNSTPIAAGTALWFSAVVSMSGVNNQLVHLTVDNSVIQFSANGASYSLKVPAGNITFDPAATSARTAFAVLTNTWTTTVAAGQTGNVWVSGMSFKLPAALPGGISPVTWTARFTSDTPGVTATWKWGAAVYSTFSSDYTTLGVKPVADTTSSQYTNADPAGTPENFKTAVIPGGHGAGGWDYTGATGSASQTVSPTLYFTNALAAVDAVTGSATDYAAGRNQATAFSGFEAEQTPGYAISKVEAVLHAYVPAPLGAADNLRLSVAVGGVAGSNVTVDHTAFDGVVGSANAGSIYIDLTSSRSWTWGDFDNGLQLTVDQSMFAPGDTVYYDAVGLRVTSVPGVDTSGGASPMSMPGGPIDISRLHNAYNSVVNAPQVWNEAPAYLQGQGMTVAVIDSGVLRNGDLTRRVIANVNFNGAVHNATDGFGHGTFVAGEIAGDGTMSSGGYIGIAPQTNIANVRVCDDQGACVESDVVAGMQWVHDHAAWYHIRVVNLSLNSSVAESPNTSAMDAAAEILWFDGIVVVASAGNNGTAALYAPANDPFVITVGATDDRGTVSMADDVMASFSAYGTDAQGGAKPDLVAPGTNIVGVLPGLQRLTLAVNHPANQVNSYYFRMSGTSMAAPIVAGAVALLLQDEPNLNPDQVKYRLKATAQHSTQVWPGYDAMRAGAGYLDIYAAVHGTTNQTANTNLIASQLLWTGNEPVSWNSVSWNSVSWNSVSWNSVSWNSVSWNSVSWNSDYWGP